MLAFSIRLKRLRRQAIDEPKLKAILAVSEQALERAEKETVLMGIHSYVTYFDFDPKKITEQNKNDDSKAVN